MKPNNYFGAAIKASPLHYCDTLEEAMPYFDAGWKGDEVCVVISRFIYFTDSYELLEECLKRGADPNAGAPDSTPLHVHYKLKFVRLLVRYGADIHARDRWGNTPLHAAQSLSLLKFYLAQGADPFAVNDDGERPGDDYPKGKMWNKMKKYLHEFIQKQQQMQSS